MPARPPLILIPALGCDEELYGGLAGLLSAHVAARTLIVARPSLAASAEEILASAPDRFIIAGTSFGGHVAREVAIAAPARVAGLWIMGAGPSAVADQEAGRRRAARARGGELAALIEEMSRTIAFPEGRLGERARATFVRMGERFDPERFALQAEALAERQDRWGALRGIVCPVLLVWGSDDRYSDPAEGRRMAGAIADARFVEVPACGHLPSLEAPREVASAAIVWMQDAGLVRGS